MASRTDVSPALDPQGDLARRFAATRRLSLDLVARLSDADASAQSMPDASPAKWHLAHTSWFFETFVLRDHLPGYRAFDDRYAYLFNSYYEAEGPRHARPRRGLLTRPSLDEVCIWRAHVDAAVQGALPDLPPAASLRAGRARHLSRATASGIAAHRHQASLRAEPARPGGVGQGNRE